MYIKLYSQYSKKTHTIPVDNAGTDSMFHKLDIRLPINMEDGIYNYELCNDDDNIIANGMMQVGDFENNNTSYTVEHNGYQQYRPE